MSNLAVFSTTVPERLGCVHCHRREREREKIDPCLCGVPKASSCIPYRQQSRSGVLKNSFSSATSFCLRCKTLSAETLEPSPHLQALTAITTQSPKLRWCTAFPHERMSSNTAYVFRLPTVLKQVAPTHLSLRRCSMEQIILARLETCLEENFQWNSLTSCFFHYFIKAA